MEIDIKKITAESAADLNLPNESFLNWGRVKLNFDGQKWAYCIEKFEADRITTDCFPDENYKFDEMGEDFYGFSAYIDGKCAGFAIYYRQWNKYIYLDNLLVLKDYRRQGIGTALMEAGMRLAEELGLVGVWTICQDNNPSAFNCYIKNGFEIGGMDMRGYDGTRQEGKSDIHLYKRISK